MESAVLTEVGLEQDGDLRMGRGRVLRKDEAYAVIRVHLFSAESTDPALSERSLAAQLGLSLGPVRSALERLRAEGLITVSPNNGIRLPEITAREVLDFYEMRMVMECHIVASLAGRLSAEQSAELEEIIADQEAAAARRDTIRYHQLDLDFHTAFAEFHGNAEMLRALRQMRDKMYRLSRRLHSAHPERLSVNAAQHRTIMEAVRDGNARGARRNMQTHLTWGRAFTLDPDRRLGRGKRGDIQT
jgi:DNA-binding GntR family transcriptional regulator